MPKIFSEEEKESHRKFLLDNGLKIIMEKGYKNVTVDQLVKMIGASAESRRTAVGKIPVFSGGIFHESAETAGPGYFCMRSQNSEQSVSRHVSSLQQSRKISVFRSD